eukprot:Gregarina_sp_Poly_1__356@NODE_1086_length_5140_cov_448_935344_g288_i1_p5_GENE_NODE_1086_length_5140_cov_448_935344_g288_i1NODE_1086_length_5140_cov_448_935344_g288_i1_p5_ORF_typecomplete_len131_score13_22Pkinase/PF00069_25/1_6e18Pkinase_Tyr/PF07714_17/9_5e11Kdo/PF06293_14/0_0002_NODE_1086_length_5140_cov_448_935344_g288_i118142206
MEKHCLIKLNPQAYRDATTKAFSFSAVSNKSSVTDADEVPLSQDHRCEHIVKLFHTFKTDSELFFVMELCDDQELWEDVRGLGIGNEELLRWYLVQVALAIQYMHSLNIVHRDLKVSDRKYVGRFHRPKI